MRASTPSIAIEGLRLRSRAPAPIRSATLVERVLPEKVVGKAVLRASLSRYERGRRKLRITMELPARGRQVFVPILKLPLDDPEIVRYLLEVLDAALKRDGGRR